MGLSHREGQVIKPNGGGTGVPQHYLHKALAGHLYRQGQYLPTVSSASHDLLATSHIGAGCVVEAVLKVSSDWGYGGRLPQAGQGYGDPQTQVR
ncbi:hypothetical protein A0257_07695 [Hymenobacter psoromatis]|nr:hypothetical protein A0257_07695 [Hymenobacter psoromatis]